jgi:mono/diheme cytochrome c family protein
VDSLTAIRHQEAMRAHLGLVLVLTLAAGCTTPPPPSDTGTDAFAGLDAGADAGHDAATIDMGMDAGADTGPPDVGTDAGTDAWAPCMGPPGLYVDGSCTDLAPGVRAFHPRYALWSDGAEKERFIYLPPGTQIDTTDPDRWGFPMGTRLYKTFSIGGQRIETRMLEKIAPGRGMSSWRMVAYLWSADGRSVSEVSPFGATDVLGTTHDIPTLTECIRCHSVAQDDAADGFSAVQLAHTEGGLNLAMLNAEGWLTTPIDPATAAVPGNATEQAALGYLHANCGSCHGGPAPEHGLDYWVRVGTPTVTSTTTWTTSVCGCSVWTQTLPSGEVANLRIAPGHPELSVTTLRMQTRASMDQMPPIGSAITDPAGIATVSDWITSLDPTSNGCPHGCPWP